MQHERKHGENANLRGRETVFSRILDAYFMATPGVGQDIEDICGRCGDAWHVVAAKLGERVVKVVCKRCGTQHNYNSGKKDEKPAASSSSGNNARRTFRKRPTRSTPEPIAAPPPFDPNQPPRSYSPQSGYGAGERINHPSFGVGIVVSAPGPGKVDVLFPVGPRTLACAKAESTLKRPEGAPIVHSGYSDRPPDKSS